MLVSMVFFCFEYFFWLSLLNKQIILLSMYDPESLKGQNILFIALLHPKQWTIGLLVGPAKWQKKLSCVSTSRTGLIMCIR